MPLAVTVLVTLLVYWAAEGYAELIAEQVHAGHLPSRAQQRSSLAAIWPLVSASRVPLLSLLVATLLGMSTRNAATVGLVVAVALLLVHGWAPAGRPSCAVCAWLRLTMVAAGFGVVMILLKLLVTR